MENEKQNREYHVQDNSDVVGTSINAAKQNYELGKYKEALNILMGIMTPDSDVFLLIGDCHYKLNSYSEALEYWNKAIGLNPKNHMAYANLGNLSYRAGNIEKAISYWLVSQVAYPEDAQTSLNLAIAFNKKEMRFESIKYFEKYLKYCEDKKSDEYLKIKQRIHYCYGVASEYLNMGVQFQSNGDDKKAAACYFKSLANYPNLSKSNLNLGSLFFQDKNLELAIKYWLTASYLDSKYEKIYSNLAISYDMMRKFDYAYCYYNRYMDFVVGNKDEYYKANSRVLKLKPYINEHPELVAQHLKKAQDHLANCRFYEAIDELTNYAILNPEEKHTYKNLIKKLEAYIHPEINLIANCFEIGNNLINQGKFSEAKHYFFRVMKLSSPQYLEYSKARAKYSQCEKAGLETGV
jgi:tetratricopeptide (TPR) repeat protein